MTALQELIDTADKLCNNLDRLAEDEKKFGIDICLGLEKYSWEVYRMMEDIKELKTFL